MDLREDLWDKMENFDWKYMRHSDGADTEKWVGRSFSLFNKNNDP